MHALNCPVTPHPPLRQVCSSPHTEASQILLAVYSGVRAKDALVTDVIAHGHNWQSRDHVGVFWLWRKPRRRPTQTDDPAQHPSANVVVNMNYTRAIGFSPALRRAAFTFKPRMFDYMHLSSTQCYAYCCSSPKHSGPSFRHSKTV